jgi:HD superfamily phosphohydrolase
MEKEIVQQIAAEVVAQLQLGDRYWMYMYLFINVVVVAVAAWLGSFLKTKGQNFATKRDFAELLKQQEKTAEAVETIKSEISQRDWVQREWTNLRRVKLEALFEKMHECEGYLDRRRDAAIVGKAGPSERNCIIELEALATLYFPELKNEVDQFVLICKNDRLQIAKFARTVSNAGDDTTARDAAFKVYENQLNFVELRLAQNTLTTAARSLLERIMNGA